MVGTGHAPWCGGIENPKPSNKMITDFIENLNRALPSLRASQKEIIKIFAGLLPTTEDGSARLAIRERIIRHSDHRGPFGLYSVSGVKFTTARLVAEKTLRLIFRKKGLVKLPSFFDLDMANQEQNRKGIFCFSSFDSSDGKQWEKALKAIVITESVQHLDDLIFRRTNLWENPHKATKIVQDIHSIFGWSDLRWEDELKRLKDKLYDTK